MTDPVKELKNFLIGLLVLFSIVLAILWIIAVVYLFVQILHNNFPNARDALELGFFLVNIVVLPLGLVALVIARGHARELENTRQGSVYMTIVDKWNSTALVNSRAKILNLYYEYNQKKQENLSEVVNVTDAEYISAFVYNLGKNNKLLEHREYVNILYFFEDLGILSRKGYIRTDDVYNFMGENITVLVGFLIPYIGMERNRESVTRPRDPDILALYANALHLYNGAKAYAPQFHREELPKLG